MPNKTVRVEWEGRPAQAFIPARLAEIKGVAASALQDAARAQGVLSATAVQQDPRLEVAARLLLRAEGVASSRIEAINAPVELIAVADADGSAVGSAVEVADNL